jgi:hypothetical protein
MPKIYITDSTDAIVGDFTQSFDEVESTNYANLKNNQDNTPVILRGLTERKVIRLCEKQKRDYYYIDTGYMGNLYKRKDYHRIVKNDVQNMKPKYDLPADRFLQLPHAISNLRFKGWKKFNGPILVVTPSAKPCMFYGIDRDQWVEETITEIKKHSDRQIIVRDKAGRVERVGNNSVPVQLVNERIHCLVTYNSIAAVEALSTGVPAIATAPGAADSLCTNNISDIESPYYPDEEKVIAWQNWLAYCQYTPKEMNNGTAIALIEEINATT